MTAGGAKAVFTSTKVAAKAAAKGALKAATKAAAKGYTKSEIKSNLKKVGKELGERAIEYISEKGQEAYLQTRMGQNTVGTQYAPDPPELELEMLADLDPTGLAGLVVAYAHSTCSHNEPRVGSGVQVAGLPPRQVVNPPLSVPAVPPRAAPAAPRHRPGSLM